MVSFKDYFSGHSSDYARYRPLYPQELFEYLAGLTAHDSAWDCATGNGQVAIALTPYFNQIYAADASSQQIAQAFPHPKISYQVARAEETNLAAQSIDLITVGMAVHWFNFEGFYQEVRRVGKSGGAIALFGYGDLEPLPLKDPANQILQAFYAQIRPTWAPEVQYVIDQYQTIPFPFVELSVPQFKMTANWTIEQLLGYFRSWSATRHYLAEHGENAIDEFEQNLASVWGDPQQAIPVEWPLFLRVGRL